MKKVFCIFLMSFLVFSCSIKNLPKDKENYSGTWQATGFLLEITKDCGVSYKRTSGAGSKSINAPIKEFVGDDFVVGILFMTTTFKVDSPPEEKDGKWYMTVDGVKLERTRL